MEMNLVTWQKYHLFGVRIRTSENLPFHGFNDSKGRGVFFWTFLVFLVQKCILLVSFPSKSMTACSQFPFSTLQQPTTSTTSTQGTTHLGVRFRETKPGCSKKWNDGRFFLHDSWSYSVKLMKSNSIKSYKSFFSPIALKTGYVKANSINSFVSLFVSRMWKMRWEPPFNDGWLLSSKNGAGLKCPGRSIARGILVPTTHGFRCTGGYDCGILRHHAV